MPKLGTLSIDNRILQAMSDDRLVVFAGAGVSMGPPANLPDFPKLARDIANGVVAGDDNEPIDRFLGRVAHTGVDVHARARALLTDTPGAPTQLHTDLLRLFQTVERVRLVTTNFDLHFQTAAQTLFGSLPEVFRAPALPRGSSFNGLVHVHGSLIKPSSMVLTDADFGRAYLTEGWARRFLVDVFRSYTVLFVGYSHNDVVMNYLARALPAGEFAGRFALSDVDGDWKLLGIEPIAFRQIEGPNVFRELYDGVAVLAERASRGALEWQTRLAEIAGRAPPVDEETAGEVEQAFRETYTTKFFTHAARDPEWLAWLDRRKLLDALFDSKPLTPAEKILCDWIAIHFSHDHPDHCFQLLAAHWMTMNHDLWWSLARSVGTENEKALSIEALRRWVAILLDATPLGVDGHYLGWLLEKSAQQGEALLALEVFLRMASDRISVQPGISFPIDAEDQAPVPLHAQARVNSQHFPLRQGWDESLRPHLEMIAGHLLSGLVRQWRSTHSKLAAWGAASRNSDARSSGRAAIERHPQDQHHEADDVLIDALRDALEWLSVYDKVQFESWIAQLADDEVPLLRRLAIHGVTEHPGLSSDQKIEWLLKHVELDRSADHHEVFRCAASAFPAASEAVRSQLIQGILAIQRLPEDDQNVAEHSDWMRFNWFGWLEQASPSCPLVKAELRPLREKYPGWKLEHPDFRGWIGSVRSHTPTSPKTLDELQSVPPMQQLDDLLRFEGDWFNGPDRSGLLGTIRELCNQNREWAAELANALQDRGEWRSDLWPVLFGAWRESTVTEPQWRELLARAARRELRAAHPREVVDVLHDLVDRGGKPFTLALLDTANGIAEQLWTLIRDQEEESQPGDWLSRAINRPAGRLTEFWVQGLSILLQGKSGADRTLSADYRRWLTELVDNPHDAAGLGRTILTSQTAFLFHLDESWATAQLIPLFSSPDAKRFAQAWDGLLIHGRLTATLVQALMPAFLDAIPRILNGPAGDRRRHFVELVAALAVFHLADPMPLLRTFLRSGAAEDRASVVTHVGWHLRNLGPEVRLRLWGQWMQAYWDERLQSMPAALEAREVGKLVEWVPLLDDAFSAAVERAMQSPVVELEHTQVMYHLVHGDLPERFPIRCAEFLIYLCRCDLGYHIRDVPTIRERLTGLEAGLSRRLEEAIARLGL